MRTYCNKTVILFEAKCVKCDNSISGEFDCKLPPNHSGPHIVEIYSKLSDTNIEIKWEDETTDELNEDRLERCICDWQGENFIENPNCPIHSPGS